MHLVLSRALLAGAFLSCDAGTAFAQDFHGASESKATKLTIHAGASVIAPATVVLPGVNHRTLAEGHLAQPLLTAEPMIRCHVHS